MKVASATLVAMLALARLGASQIPSTGKRESIALIGPAGQQRAIGLNELRSLPNFEVDVSSHNVHGRYSGVPLGTLLRLVGRPAGDSLRGTELAQVVLVEASDGYRVVFAPAELDSGFTDKSVLVAYEKNGAPLDSAEGPFRVIAAGEKRPARWVRGVVRVQLRSMAP